MLSLVTLEVRECATGQLTARRTIAAVLTVVVAMTLDVRRYTKLQLTVLGLSVTTRTLAALELL